jgi:hypothetical protein
MTSEQGQDNVTGLFSAITLMDIIAGPSLNYVLAFTFKQGLKLGGVCIGLPFFSAAMLFAIVTAIVFSVSHTPIVKEVTPGIIIPDAESPVAPVIQPQESAGSNLR